MPPELDPAQLDPYDPGLTEPEVWRAYERARAAGPVVRSTARGGFWVLTGFADVRDALLDAATFSSASGHRIPTDGTQHAIPIDLDPPRHGSFRRLLRDVLAPARVRELQPFLSRTVDGLVDGFAARGGGDFVRDVALPLPLAVLAELVGFSPATVARFREVTEQLWDGIEGGSAATAAERIDELMRAELAAHRRDRPDDWVTRLLDARIEADRIEADRIEDGAAGPRPLSEDEQANILATLAVAGHETTMNAAGSVAYLLATGDGHRERLRAEPASGPAFVEEALRLRTPVQNFARRTTCPAHVGGTTIPEGDAVLLSYAAANRDPARFPDPDAFDPARDTRGQLAFGWGTHLCLGATLARTELALLLAALVRHPPLRVAGEVRWSGLRGGNHLGPTHLPLAFS